MLVGIASLVMLLDQWSKYRAVETLTGAFALEEATTVGEKLEVFFQKKKLERIRTKPVVVHPDHFQLRYVENPGAAWGMLGGLDDKVRIPFFYVVSILAIAFLTVVFSRVRREQRLLALAFSLILGGALGNFMDRLVRGYVIDFIDWHWRYQSHWPTFNIADVAISLGMAGLILEGIFGTRIRRVDEPSLERRAVDDETMAESRREPGAHDEREAHFEEDDVEGQGRRRTREFVA